MKTVLNTLLFLLLKTTLIFAEVDTLVLQNGASGYEGCEDRSIFQFKKKFQ